MEKFWIKKELYFSSYEFLKFLTFSDFNLIFNDFLMIYLLLKSRKRGVLFHRPRGADVARTLTWRQRLTWCARLAQMRRDTQGHVAELARPTRRAGGAGGAGGVDTWQEATRVHADARVVPRGRGDGR